ncbi:MAG: A/G-specific adenine glycosylase [Methylobacillus sp.]|jgi:A/G-specific adenine glycosylase|nr:A/G-specific adenine glycosylase [Methylobacillus sp.]
MRDFAARLIAWQQIHGRHDLPWQNTHDPYAIWVSEIMLQQTQVSAVIPYYTRFMASFPDIAALAAAHEDAVLEHWSGLGYYSRARNLHAAAQYIIAQHEGRFPQQIEQIEALPGIGRSTAAAIACFAFGQRHAILDGNVKRVLARVFGIAGWPGQTVVEKRMWALAESLLPQEASITAYTQGIMDLGATLCTRSQPRCAACPFADACVAHVEQRISELPSPKPRKTIPEKRTVMLLLLSGDEILLEKRPPTGIWGGLWSLPEADETANLPELARQRFGCAKAELAPALPPFSHTFSHFRLEITPQPVWVEKTGMAEQGDRAWLAIEDALGAALPAPVRKLLKKLAAEKPLKFAGKQV